MVKLRIVNDGLNGQGTKVFFIDKDGIQIDITHCKIVKTEITLPADGDNEAVLTMFEPGIDIMAKLTGIKIADIDIERRKAECQ